MFRTEGREGRGVQSARGTFLSFSCFGFLLGTLNWVVFVPKNSKSTC